MKTTVAKIIGIIIGVLVLAGLFVEGRLLLGSINVDIALDLIRLVLAGALLYAGFIAERESAARSALLLTGAVCIAIGLFGMMDRTLAGLLPTGLTNFDLAIHWIIGIVALGVGLSPINKKELRVEKNL